MNATKSFLTRDSKSVTALLLIQPNTDLCEIMKLTLAHLLHHKVFTIKQKSLKLNSRDKYFREYTIIEAGENYTGYKPTSYENHFIKNLDNDSFYILKSFLRVVYEEIKSRYNFSHQVIDQEKLQRFFHSNLFTYLFGKIIRTAKGKKLGNQLQIQIENLEKQLGSFSTNHEEELALLFSTLGSHVMLFKNFEWDGYKTNKTIQQDFLWMEFWYNYDFNKIFESVTVHQNSDYVDDYDSLDLS